MDPTLAGIAATAISGGIEFLYQQAGEFIKTWRENRKGKKEAPKVIAPPTAVTVGQGQPLVEPADSAMLESMESLHEMLRTIRDGKLDPEAPEAREIVAETRALLEIALRATVTFAGESRRPEVQARDVHVTAERVTGRVAGLRANLEKLKGNASVGSVTVKTGDVESGGDVAGIDLK